MRNHKKELHPLEYIALFIGFIGGILAGLFTASVWPSLVCSAQVHGTSAQYNQTYPSNPSSQSNPSSLSNLSSLSTPSSLSNHDLRTYLYKCGIWESYTIRLPSNSPTNIDPDVFDQIINGTEPSATSIYGYTLNYRPY